MAEIGPLSYIVLFMPENKWSWCNKFIGYYADVNKDEIANEVKSLKCDYSFQKLDLWGWG